MQHLTQVINDEYSKGREYMKRRKEDDSFKTILTIVIGAVFSVSMLALLLKAFLH